MTTRQELEKMVEEQAGQHQMEEKDRFPQSHAREETLLADARTRSFKSGASFMRGILQDEIERWKSISESSHTELEVKALVHENESFRKELTAANERIKELEAENQRFRSALSDAKNLLEDDYFENWETVVDNIKEALPPPERGEE